MKIDFYTKVILTIIAVALVVIAARLTPPVEAARNEPIPVNIVQVDGRNVFRSLPVTIVPK